MPNHFTSTNAIWMCFILAFVPVHVEGVLPEYSTSVISHFVNVGGSRFATLDNTSPLEATRTGCQDSFIQLPDGWAVASDDDLSTVAVVSFSWGTECIVVAGGVSRRSRGGNLCGGNMLVTATEGDVVILKVSSCARRILISQPGSVEDVDVSAAVTITNVVSHYDLDYATIDNTPADDISWGCQGSAVMMPAGWQIAEDSSTTREALAFLPYTWGTGCVVLSNGQSVTTDGSNCGSDLLLSVAGRHAVSGCSRRVLITRPSSPSSFQAVPITNFLVVGGTRYATLDNAAPASSTSPGCQTALYSLPSGWSLAEDSNSARAAILSAGWSTTCVVLASGDAFVARALYTCGTYQLEITLGDGDVTVYRPRECARRILIEQPMTAGDVDASISAVSFSFVKDEVQYATLDNAPPSAQGAECQELAIQLSAEWSFAENSEATKDAILTVEATFAATCLVLDGGVSIYTYNGMPCGNDQLLSVGGFHSVTACSRRILISRAAVGVADTDVVPFDAIGSVSNFISVSGSHYATIDNTPPYTKDIGCQESFYIVPEGWVLAERSTASIVAVASFPWGTGCAVLADGSAWSVMTGGPCGDGYLAVGNGGAVPVYRPSTCDRRILIQRAGLAGDDDLSVSVITSSFVITGYEYAALDNTPVDQVDRGCQYAATALPDGWEVAPNNEQTKSALLGVGHQFGTNCLVLADGSSLYSHDPNLPCGDDQLAEVEGHFTVVFCDRRVLIRRATTSANSWTEQCDASQVQTFFSHGYIFSTADCNYPHDPALGCQTVGVRISPGWSIPGLEDPGVKRALVSKFFGAACLILQDGHAYAHDASRCMDNALSSAEGGTILAPRACSLRILIAQRTIDEALCTAWGDPHITTFDGFYYDFYQLGEFIMAADLEGDLMVQLRTFRTGRAASNSAVAISIGGHTVAMYTAEHPAPPTLTVNGEGVVMESGDTLSLPGGEVQIHHYGKLLLDTTDGTDDDFTFVVESSMHRLKVVAQKSVYDIQFFHVYLFAKDLVGKVTGLCGNWNYVAGDDFMSDSSAEVASEAKASFQITDPADSLFEYGPGESPMSTEDPDFAPTYSPDDLPADVLAECQAQCDGLGLVEPYITACYLDVASTGGSIATTVQAEENSDDFVACDSASEPVNIISFNGNSYALLDGTSPYDSTIGCQLQTLTIPDGWHVAPDTIPTRALATCHPWGTNALLLDSGTAVSTADASVVGVNELVRGGEGLACVQVSSCNKRVLIERETVLDLDAYADLLSFENLTAAVPLYDGIASSAEVHSGAGAVEVVSPGGVMLTVPLNQVEAQAFAVSVWVKSFNVSGDPNSTFSLQVTSRSVDGDELVFEVFLPTGSYDWLQRSVEIVAKKPVSYVVVSLQMVVQSGRALFDDVSIDRTTGNMLFNRWFDTAQGRPAGAEAYAWDAATDGGYDVLDDGSVQVVGEAPLVRGLVQFLYINDPATETEARTLLVSAESSSTEVEDLEGSGYGIYVDVMFKNGSAFYGRKTPFSSGTHGFETKTLAISIHAPILWINVMGYLSVEGTAVFRNFHATIGPCAQDGTFASSFGDPHLVTYDGLLYDMQAIGEFVLTRRGGFEVQIRHSPVKNAAINTGVAVRCEGSEEVVEVVTTTRFANPEVRLRGMLVPNVAMMPLVDGGVLLREGKVSSGLRLKVVCPATGRQGDVVEVAVHVSASGVQFLTVSPSLIAMDRPVEGLLGNNDGDASNDLQDGVGKSLSPDSPPSEVIPFLAARWAVTNTNSLFTYPYDKGPEDYRDEDAPFPPALEDFDETSVAAARMACAKLEEPTRSACVLDHLYTHGDVTVLDVYSSVQTHLLTNKGSDNGGTDSGDDALDETSGDNKDEAHELFKRITRVLGVGLLVALVLGACCGAALYCRRPAKSMANDTLPDIDLQDLDFERRDAVPQPFCIESDEEEWPSLSLSDRLAIARMSSSLASPYSKLPRTLDSDMM